MWGMVKARNQVPVLLSSELRIDVLYTEDFAKRVELMSCSYCFKKVIIILINEGGPTFGGDGYVYGIDYGNGSQVFTCLQTH